MHSVLLVYILGCSSSPWASKPKPSLTTVKMGGIESDWASKGCIYLDPQWPLLLKLQPTPKQDLFQSKTGVISVLDVYIYTYYVVVLTIFHFHPCLGKISSLTIYYVSGWGLLLEGSFTSPQNRGRNLQVPGSHWSKFRNADPRDGASVSLP